MERDECDERGRLIGVTVIESASPARTSARPLCGTSDMGKLEKTLRSKEYGVQEGLLELNRPVTCASIEGLNV